MTEVDAIRFIGTNAEKNSLPRAIVRTIKEKGLPRLRAIRKSISEAANLPMPPVRVVPWGLVAPNSIGVVWGYHSHVECGEMERIGAYLPASALMYINNDITLRRLLVHEYAHCFYQQVQILTQMYDGVLAPSIQTGGSIVDQYRDLESRDRMMLVSPNGWFAFSDTRAFIEDYHDDSFNQCNNDFYKHWERAGLPTKIHDLTPQNSKTGEIPDEVVERAHALGLLKNLPPQPGHQFEVSSTPHPSTPPAGSASP